MLRRRRRFFCPNENRLMASVAAVVMVIIIRIVRSPVASLTLECWGGSATAAAAVAADRTGIL